ncbi:4Fe-4S dicluster domain-containing protein [bacterium]|nr:4Fe-4S dicluster domain-containing protein [bacterium]RQV97456.1 MAG: 4Fe-4S dicluster domain-containing protein [bacterium]
MDSEKTIYKNLQKHLNNQPVGFPATHSGIEIRLLKHFFTPEEAQLALCLNYKPTPMEQIYEKIDESRMSLSDMEKILDGMLKKGSVGHMERDGVRYFFTMPLVVGMYEGHLERLTPEFLRDFEKYTSHKTWGLDFLSTEVSQMRTIPIEKSISIEHHIATYDQLTHLINESDAIVINECICRKTAAMKGNPCQKTSRVETCMALGDIAKNCIRIGIGREISKEEALDIARQNEADGLILQPSNSQKAEFICACCGCCCGMLSVYNLLPRPHEFWTTNYHASVDSEICTGCKTCIERCQVHAIRMNEELGVATIDIDRCIGCGICVSTCPSEALTLIKKDNPVVPPEDSETLYETIMNNKKGKLEKIKHALRLLRK